MTTREVLEQTKRHRIVRDLQKRKAEAETDIFGFVGPTKEHLLREDDERDQLYHLLKEHGHEMTEVQIDKIVKHHFRQDETLGKGESKYPRHGAFLMHNLYPKRKKKKKTGTPEDTGTKSK